MRTQKSPNVTVGSTVINYPQISPCLRIALIIPKGRPNNTPLGMVTVLGGVHGYDFNLRGWDDKWERVWIKSHGIFWFSHHKCWDLWMSISF